MSAVISGPSMTSSRGRSRILLKSRNGQRSTVSRSVMRSDFSTIRRPLRLRWRSRNSRAGG
ncbi:Uncharacterised protein [Mycobacteroides abscessus subsp. abscessus]|nr:Uncharacterised protein [Mycobacteroides abscessus subsp. abscessus]SKW11398.1 Uncharacterised protein [Mycobacteroides abscessus subsp. abscessus]